mmetsp:Transcript_3439/g.3915  ORF Transcript_3439/g.3915 Transcript_3439/m.3915 type:complete len:350 (+) Transcript_3439:466-1515(+)
MSAYNYAHSGFSGLPGQVPMTGVNMSTHQPHTILQNQHYQQQIHHQQPMHHQQQNSSRSRSSKNPEEKEKGKNVQHKEFLKYKEKCLKQAFELVVLKRQLHVSNSRLGEALEGLKLAKENKPFHKKFSLAMNEKAHLKGLPKADIHEFEFASPIKFDDGEVETRIVATKKGERQRPAKYSTRSKEEMIVISAAADYVVSGTSTLREAKEALKDLGIKNFETSLSNKMYNHPGKKEYLKMRKEKRDMKKLEITKKTELRNERKKKKQLQNQQKESRKRAKKLKKQQHPHTHLQMPQVPILHEMPPQPAYAQYPGTHAHMPPSHAHHQQHHPQHHMYAQAPQHQHDSMFKM